ncbi:hypothetical protein FGG08_006118 [Glutinoglossum americanum]|uniref:RTA1-like protein n=1 Tax=Glutinoglossum americanum TaxID=1670608 RepID=A0A9P8HX00_9PEZI|nr:hypothetical protein FGG08_006118 [Glutinoglossum americanum]
MTPGKYGRVPPEACNSYYSFDPNFSAAVGVGALFGIVSIAHLVLGFAWRKGFTWVIIMGSLWETFSFVVRALGAHDQQNLAYAIVSQLLLLLAPLWVNAFAYMLLGRMIHFYLPSKSLFGIKAPAVARYFVCFDILSFIVQGIGGSMISPGSSQETIMKGIHVYMGGIGLQELFLLIFSLLVVRFQRQMSRGIALKEIAPKEGWRRLTGTLYAVLTLITVRIIYRLVEYASGIKPSNPIPYHEAYTYGLDALPMFLAITVLCIMHPGRFLRGPDSVFPKKTRAEKRAEKREKKAKKEAEREEKRGRKEAEREQKRERREGGRSGEDLERGVWEREAIRE